MTQTATIRPRHQRPPGLPKYVIEAVLIGNDDYEGSMTFTLRREVLWSVAHLFQSAPEHFPEAASESLKEMGNLIESASRVIFDIASPAALDSVELFVDADGSETEADFDSDNALVLNCVNLQEGFVRLTLFEDTLLVAGKLLQGIFTYLDDGKGGNRSTPRSWAPLRSLGNKMLKAEQIIVGDLDPQGYLMIADEVYDVDGNRILDNAA